PGPERAAPAVGAALSQPNACLNYPTGVPSVGPWTGVSSGTGEAAGDATGVATSPGTWTSSVNQITRLLPPSAT
ncbi:MAG: hypothetical protein ACTHMX_01040, partial [Thermomicrobiales bacterium]